jgi:hypothetical protein
VILCGPLRIFAFSVLNRYFNAEAAEVRRENFKLGHHSQTAQKAQNDLNIEDYLYR